MILTSQWAAACLEELDRLLENLRAGPQPFPLPLS